MVDRSISVHHMVTAA